MTGLLVADHFDQEVDEIGGLDHGAAILAIPQGREGRLAGDVDVPSARGTGVIGRDSRLSHLVDEIIHVHVDLRHDLSSTVPPDLTGFLPHPELLEDAGRRLVVIGVARDHLAVLAQRGSTHHATSSAQTPTAEATAFAFSQSVLVSGLYQLVPED